MTQDKINKIFSTNLNRLFNLKNKNQYELAEYLGVSSQTITNYVKGYNAPRMDKVDKIAEFFGVSREELLTNKSQGLPSDYFETKEDAIEYLMNQKVIAANTGIDISKYSDEEIVQFTNRLLDYARFLDNDKKKMD